jgi:hypothetical protein
MRQQTRKCYRYWSATKNRPRRSAGQGTSGVKIPSELQEHAAVGSGDLDLSDAIEFRGYPHRVGVFWDLDLYGGPHRTLHRRLRRSPGQQRQALRHCCVSPKPQGNIYRGVSTVAWCDPGPQALQSTALPNMQSGHRAPYTARNINGLLATVDMMEPVGPNRGPKQVGVEIKQRPSWAEIFAISSAARANEEAL